jgi:hypothetical protein
VGAVGLALQCAPGASTTHSGGLIGTKGATATHRASSYRQLFATSSHTHVRPLAESSGAPYAVPCLLVAVARSTCTQVAKY